MGRRMLLTGDAAKESCTVWKDIMDGPCIAKGERLKALVRSTNRRPQE